MALEVPDTEDLRVHMHQTEPFSSIETEWAEYALQHATDLAEVGTGWSETPTNELHARLLNVGILSMAHMLYVTGGEDREALYSPYSSERLGSYSYTKAQSAVTSGKPTGVPEFDYIVDLARSLDTDEGGLFTTEAEAVFKQPYAEAQAVSRGIALQEDAWNMVWPSGAEE